MKIPLNINYSYANINDKTTKRGVMKMGLFDPNPNEVDKILQKHEKEYGYCDKVIYQKCLEDFKKLDLCNFPEDITIGIIKVFLINWGMLGRVLGRIEKKGWERKLSETLREKCETLEKFRKLSLEDFKSEEELSKYKEQIKDCYKAIRNLIGPVGASKVLHLINPEFFPMWDENIRKKASEECKKPIEDSEEGYYRFMNCIRELLLNRKMMKLWEKWSKEIGTSKLRIIDIYLWWKANEKNKK